jgi:hypothetical protein
MTREAPAQAELRPTCAAAPRATSSPGVHQGSCTDNKPHSPPTSVTSVRCFSPIRAVLAPAAPVSTVQLDNLLSDPKHAELFLVNQRTGHRNRNIAEQEQRQSGYVFRLDEAPPWHPRAGFGQP